MKTSVGVPAKNSLSHIVKMCHNHTFRADAVTFSKVQILSLLKTSNFKSPCRVEMVDKPKLKCLIFLEEHKLSRKKGDSPRGNNVN